MHTTQRVHASSPSFCSHTSAVRRPYMQRRLQNLDDGAAAMLEAYAKLLKSAQVHGETEQQVGEFQSSVLVAGLVRQRPRRPSAAHPSTPHSPRDVLLLVLTQVHATDNLLSISGELKRTALLSDDAAGHTSTEPGGTEPADRLRARLTVLRGEMQQALHELEASYYAPPSVPTPATDTSRPAGLVSHSQQR